MRFLPFIKRKTPNASNATAQNEMFTEIKPRSLIKKKPPRIIRNTANPIPAQQQVTESMLEEGVTWIDTFGRELEEIDPVCDGFATEMSYFVKMAVVARVYGELPREHPLRRQYGNRPKQVLDFACQKTFPYHEKSEEKEAV